MLDQTNRVAPSAYPAEHHWGHFKCISWSAVFTGALIGLGLSFLLNLFAIGIGLAAYHTSEQGAVAFAIGGFVGMAIGIFASMFFAGWVTGYLARFTSTNRHLGALYGLTTWCLTLAIAVMLAGHFRPFVVSQFHSLTNSSEVAMAMSAYGGVGTEPQANTSTVPSVNGVITTITTSPNTVPTIAEKEKAAKALSANFFAMFILFFLGAAASCFGGYCGLNPTRYAYRENYPNIPPKV